MCCDFDVAYTAQYQNSSVIMPGNSTTIVPVLSINSWIIVHNKLLGGKTRFDDKSWLQYRNGFGDLSLDINYWIGNEIIHQLTSAAPYMLRVEVEFFIIRTAFSFFFFKNAQST
jgi:hypothetical protein